MPQAQAVGQRSTSSVAESVLYTSRYQVRNPLYQERPAPSRSGPAQCRAQSRPPEIAATLTAARKVGAFPTKPVVEKKANPMVRPFFLMIANAIENAPAVDAGNPLFLVSVGGLNSAIDKNAGYFQLRSRTCIRNPPLFLRHSYAIG
jgi:hypothetical protein